MLFNNLVQIVTVIKWFHELHKVDFQYLVHVIVHKLSYESDHLINKTEVAIEYKYLFDILILLPYSCQLILHILDVQNLSKYYLIFELTLLIQKQIQRLFYIHLDTQTLNQWCTLFNQIFDFLLFSCFNNIQLVHLFIDVEFPDTQFDIVIEHTVVHSTCFYSQL